ncbi:MAG TPA: hypothetical protein VG889_10400 [Rhizomicrobium sp.]|nr:hypothetical protein [Rhizomicrobium sp.]
MRHFVPALKPEPQPPLLARVFGRGERATDRLGGVPVGLPTSRWPKCAECGKSQSLLAQFRHQPGRLDLGRDGRMLFAFQCNHDTGLCSTWELDAGANACFAIEPEELTRGPTPAPADNPPADDTLVVEAWIAKDGDGGGETRLGGLPCWLQNENEGPGEGWRFVGQLAGENGANFGGGGIAYLFVKDGTTAGALLWQR